MLKGKGVLRSEGAAAQHWSVMEDRKAADGQHDKLQERRKWTQDEDVRLLALHQLGVDSAAPTTRQVVDWATAAPLFPGRRKYDLQQRLSALKDKVKRAKSKKAAGSEVDKLVAIEVKRLQKERVTGPSGAPETEGPSSVPATPATVRANESLAARATAGAPAYPTHAQPIAYLPPFQGAPSYPYAPPPPPPGHYPYPYAFPFPHAYSRPYAPYPYTPAPADPSDAVFLPAYPGGGGGGGGDAPALGTASVAREQDEDGHG
ncbi:hypothetical protein JCM3770_002510 [Rhodotorula araucariae]